MKIFIVFFFFSNLIISQTLDATDPEFVNQWYLKMSTNRADIRAPEAWYITTGSSNTKMAILEQYGNPNSIRVQFACYYNIFH